MLNTLDITKYIAACANRAGVSVVWKDGATPSTDGRTMWLPPVNAYAPNDQMTHLRQWVKHETSHVLYSDFDLLNVNRPTGILAFVNNLLEDHRIDYLNDSDYAGDKQNTESYWPLYDEEMRKHVVQAEAKDWMMPLFAWDMSVRNDLWLTLVDPFTRNVSAKGRTILDKLNKGDYATVLRNIRSIKDKTEGGVQVYELAKRIIREVFDADPESMTEPEKERAKAAGKPSDGEGGEGKEKGEGKGDDGKGEEGEVSVNDKLRDIDCEGAMMLPYSKHDKRSEGVNARNYSCGSGEAYSPTAANDIIEVNFVTGDKRNTTHSFSPDVSYANQMLTIADKGAGLANQVRTQLQIICRDRYEYGKKRGKLHNGALYRVGMKDAKGLNERLFKQKIENQSLDVSVQILCDASGSMSGSKFTNAAAAAVVLNNVLSNTLHVPLEILAFTEWGDKHTMYVAKEFGKNVTSHALASSFSAMNDMLLDNVDGESLMYGFNRIRQRKERRKLMIVLSDGSPCGGHRKGAITHYTKRVIKGIEGSPVEIVGVGLQYDGVKNYYKRWAKIDDARNIEHALLSLISNHIIRSV